MTSWLILLGCWTIPGALVVTWYHADRLLARRAAAKRLAEAEAAFWTSLAAFVDRARADIDAAAATDRVLNDPIYQQLCFERWEADL